MGIFKKRGNKSEAPSSSPGGPCSASNDSGSGGACKTCSVSGCQSRKEGEEKKNPVVARIKKKIVVMSGKGGVGKSTVAASIASGLVRAGKSVGLLDVDLHGPSLPRMMGLAGKKPELRENVIVPVQGESGLKVLSLGLLLPDEKEAVIWRGPVKMGLIKQFIEDVEWGDLDFLVVDCPPGTGDEPLSVLQILGTDALAVIVTTPQGVAVDDVRRSISFCSKVGNPVLGVVENMSGFVCPTCNAFHDIFGSGGGKALAAEMGVPFLGAIPLSPGVRKAGDEGRTAGEGSGDDPAANALAGIVEEILTRTA